MVQVLKEFENRTEYKVLKNYTPCDAVAIDALLQGVLVIPAIVLVKLPQEKLINIHQWIEDNRNQLIIVPTWIEMNIQTYVNASVPIEVVELSSYFDVIPVNYQIRSSVKEVIFEQNRQIFGINYRRNTGSGLITIVTLPLLDYKLSEYIDLNKKLFDKLLLVQTNPEIDNRKINGELELTDIHVYLLLLAASDINFNSGISTSIRKYFNIDATEDRLRYKYNELLTNGYIREGKVSDIGLGYIKQNNLKAFIRTIRERELKNDEWS